MKDGISRAGRDSSLEGTWIRNVLCRFGEQLTAEQRGTLRALLGEFSSVMSNTPGQTTLAEHRIETGTARTVKLPPYRIPHAYRGAVEKEIQEMLEEGIIEPSMSVWCSPIVPVKKKDGSLHLCVDYRWLNSISQSDSYDLIDQLEVRITSLLWT